jgi:NADH:ubiquinone oxidoreductase subunit 5 (subunit L)/multisubunit Na+/H+ antiporter MnhA subunit
MRYMPWVGWLVLVGVCTSSGLPPLSGFVAEWMLLQSFLFTPGLPDPFLNMLIPIVAAGIALVAALSGYALVKFFGVIFLGQPREENLRHAHDAGFREKIGMVWLATWCVLLGLFPQALVRLIDPLTQQLVGAGLAAQVDRVGWFLFAPNDIERASFSPLGFLVGITAGCLLAYLLVRILYHGRVRRAPPWDCGFPAQTPRMQDTAEGFGQPIRQIFEPFFRLERHLPAASDLQPHYKVVVGDHFWHWLYLPVARSIEFLARQVGRLQQGRISIYLLYSFLTLLCMLFLVQR